MKPYYDDGTCTIYHADCREVLAGFAGTINTTVTSPPYNTLGSRVPAKPTGMHASNQWLAKVSSVGYADDMDEDAYAEWQAEIAAAIRAVTAPGGSMFYNHKLRSRDGRSLHPIHITDRFAGWRLRQELIWDRAGAVQFNARMFAPSDERIIWLVKNDGTHKWNQEAATWLSVWRIAPKVGGAADGHPCPYPLTLPKRCIAATTDPGDLVLDPFAGAGTTLRAAKDLGRKAIGIEIEERFCEIAAKRLAQEVLDLGA